MIVANETALERPGYLLEYALEYARRTGVVGPIMAVPLAARGQALGGLAVARAQWSPAFSAADIHIVRTFAAQASVALELSQVRDELRQLAIVQERERIAREMHDGVIQSLFGLGMNLQAVATTTTLPPGVGERLNLAVDGIDAAISDLRNYIFGLRPGLLANRELDDALRRLAADLESHGEVRVAVEIEPLAAVLLSRCASDVVQVAREALSNVRRHANASMVQLRLSRAGAHALLEIIDDGCGLPPSTGHGLGLGNMRARAAALGGELLVGPGEHQRGTTITLAIPL
jgi:signal transduction histidine kinase